MTVSFTQIVLLTVQLNTLALSPEKVLHPLVLPLASSEVFPLG